MADEDSISAAVQAVRQHIGAGGLNLLINNAAINKPAPPAPLLATGKKDMMEVYETNVVGPFILSKVRLSFFDLYGGNSLQKGISGDSTLRNPTFCYHCPFLSIFLKGML